MVEVQVRDDSFPYGLSDDAHDPLSRRLLLAFFWINGHVTLCPSSSSYMPL